MKAVDGFEPTIKLLQSRALPLGYTAITKEYCTLNSEFGQVEIFVCKWKNFLEDLKPYERASTEYEKRLRFPLSQS